MEHDNRPSYAIKKYLQQNLKYEFCDFYANISSLLRKKI